MKKQSTLRGAIYITIGRILSKIIGIFRERLFAVYFGTSYVVDIVKLVISLMGLITGAIIYPILRYGIPNITEAYGNEDFGHIKHNTQVILLLAGTLGTLISLILVLFPTEVIRLFTPYIYSDPEKLKVASSIVVISGYMAIVYVFATIFENILIALHIYTHLGIKDPLINTIWTTIVAGFPVPAAIVWGRTLGALVYASFVLFLLYKAFEYMKRHFNHTGAPSRKHLVKDIFRGTLPLYIGGSIGLINQFIDRWMAGYLGEGNIAIIGYGSVIAGIIGGLLIQPFAQSIYPKVSGFIRNKDYKGFLKETHGASQLILFFAIPSLFAVAVLYFRIAFFFFGGDKISYQNIATIGIVASIMSGVQLLVISQIYTSAFVPMKRTDIGMKVSMFVVPLNILLNYLLAFVFHMGSIGLKTATLIASLTGNSIMLYILSRMIGGLDLKSLLPSTIKTLIATLAMLVFIYPLDKILPQTRVFTLLIVFIGATVYFVVAYIEGHEVMDKLVDKIASLGQ